VAKDPDDLTLPHAVNQTMTGTHSIEPMLEKLYSPVLDPAGLHAFAGNLDDSTDFVSGKPRFEQRRRSLPIRHDSSNCSAAVALSKEQRHAVSNGTGVARLLQPHLHTAYAVQRRLNHLKPGCIHTLHGLVNQASAPSFAVHLDQYVQTRHGQWQSVPGGSSSAKIRHGIHRAGMPSSQPEVSP
jgi:hypothetical protein